MFGRVGRGSFPQPLTEPYVRLSPHTALLKELLYNREAVFPVFEQVRGDDRLFFEPCSGFFSVVSEAFMLLSCPFDESVIKYAKDRLHIHVAEFPVIYNPASYHGIDTLCQLRQVCAYPAMQAPCPHDVA